MQQILWTGITQPQAQRRILFTPLRSFLMSCQGPMLPKGLLGDILFSVFVVMCFLQQFLSHQIAPRISSLWPLHGQYFWLLSFLAEGKKDCAKGRDPSFLLPYTARAVEVKKNRLQGEDTTGRAELINKPIATSITSHDLPRVCIKTARPTMPQSFRNEEEVLRVLLVPIQLPFTGQVPIPTSCGCVGIDF